MPKKAASRLKVKMAGGAFSDNTTTTLIIILFMLTGVLFAWLMYKHIHSKKTHVQSVYRKNIITTEPSHVIEPQTQVIKIITDSREDRAPIYPKHNPVYPLQRSPGGYQQVGVLVSQDSAEEKPIIMPLFGRKMYSKDRWEYYTASDEYHMWRIPVSINNRDCQDDVGCDEIYNGDNVTVPDYANKVFVARIYKYRAPNVFAEPY
jgi:hypothetical protein